MEALKVKSGSNLQDTSVTGRITAKMVLAFSSIRMETSMKECGELIADMDKALTGEMRMESSEENTLVIGSRIRSMEEEPFSIRMVIDMMATGSTVCLKAKGE